MENDESRPVNGIIPEMSTETGTTANISERPHFSGRRFVLALVAALVFGLTLMATLSDSLWAAIELAYYRGAATNNAVFLEWATVREVNINGFEILCKRVNDPETSYHAIGSRIALGNATTGRTYNFDVTSGLIPGERYCFRLREITTDNTPGEAFDLCGYGLGLTPPPTPLTPITVVVSIPITLTPTVVTVTQVPGLSPAPTLPPTPDPFATPTWTPDPFATATPTQDPFATPTWTPDPFATATPTITPTPTQLGGQQGISPLPSPSVTATGTVTATTTVTTSTASAEQQLSDPNLASSPVETPTTDPNGIAAQVPVTDTGLMTPSPLEEATPTPTETPTEIPSDAPTTLELPPLATPTATLTNSIQISLTPESQGSIPDGSAAAVAAEVTATPIYVVVTATPTPEAALVAAPTFTPWPTAIPTAEFAFSNLLVPSTQNLMVGLLCLIFLSASGLGALGLVTSVLYMRSQTRRDRLPGPIYERRRY